MQRGQGPASSKVLSVSRGGDGTDAEHEKRYFVFLEPVPREVFTTHDRFDLDNALLSERAAEHFHNAVNQCGVIVARWSEFLLGYRYDRLEFRRNSLTVSGQSARAYNTYNKNYTVNYTRKWTTNS